MRKLGVNYLVIHNDDYDRLHEDEYQVRGKRIPSSNDIHKLLKQETAVREVFSTKDTVIYQLR